MSINDLKPAVKRKAIKIYLDTFIRQPVPCPTCAHHCCQGCHSARGYILSDFPGQLDGSSTKRFEELKEKYGWTDRTGDNTYTVDWKNEDQGFFVAGKGCRIPYKERSRLCVAATCAQMTNEQRDAGSKLYTMLWKEQQERLPK